MVSFCFKCGPDTWVLAASWSHTRVVEAGRGPAAGVLPTKGRCVAIRAALLRPEPRERLPGDKGSR